MSTNSRTADGNWSDSTKWSAGHVPTSDEDVNLGDYITEMNVASITCVLITSSGSGYLTVDLSAGPKTINANVTGSIGSTVSVGGSTYALTFNGTATGGVGLIGIEFVSSGVTLTGTFNTQGGTGGGGVGIYMLANSTVTATGNMTGGSATNCSGLKVGNGSTVTINNGTITGGGTASLANCYGVEAGTSTSTIIANNCNLIYGNSQPVQGRLTYNPAASNYIQIGSNKYPPQLLANQVAYGVTHGNRTGTFTAPNTDGHTPNAALVLTSAHFGADNGTQGAYVAPVQAGYSALAAGYGEAGGTSGTLAASKIHDTTYGTLADASVLVAAGGTFDEAARNVDPGITKVLAPASGGPTNYKIANSTLVGTATAPLEADVWHDTGTYGVGGTAKTPSKVGSSITNLTVGNLRSGVTVDDVGPGTFTHTTDYVAIAVLPTASKVFHGIDRGDGETGTLTVANIGTAAGSSHDVTAAMLPDGWEIDTLTGTGANETAAAAAQLVTDQAEVSAKKAYIYPNADILGQDDGTLRASNIGTLAGTDNLVVGDLRYDVTVDDVVGDLRLPNNGPEDEAHWATGNAVLVAVGAYYDAANATAGTAVLTEDEVAAAVSAIGANVAQLLLDVADIPTDPLLTGDSRLPATVIAAKADLPADYQQRGVAVTLPSGVATEAKQDAAKTVIDGIATTLSALGTLTPDERNAVADALLARANAIDGKTPQEALRIMAAVLAGKVSGAGSGTEQFTGLDGSTLRVEVTTDASGNRTNVNYNTE